MWKLACLSFAVLVMPSAFSQSVSPIASAPAISADRMVVPPPVSIDPYKTRVRADARSNYLQGGISFVTSYIDNLYAASGRPPIAERIYTVSPTLDFDQTTSTRHTTVRYSPGFLFYQPSSALNEVNQNANLEYQVRLTPHSEINLNDNLQYRSTPYYSGILGSGGTVSGSTQTVTPGVIVPYAKRLSNSANGEFTLQTGRSSMVGIAGSATTLHFPDLSETSGIFDSNSQGGMGFYSGRFSSAQYYGVVYQYGQTHAFPPNAESEIRLQSAMVFYTIYPKEHLSLSVSSGPQNYRVSQTSAKTTDSWSPAVSTSIGWRGLHTSFAAGYSQMVTGGGGLVGAYHSRSTNATAAWQISRGWAASGEVRYAINKNVTPFLVGAYRGGHGIFGTVRLQHPLGQQLNFAFEYSRLHQSYNGIQVISSNPNSNSVTASITWRFMRPLGQ